MPVPKHRSAADARAAALRAKARWLRTERDARQADRHEQTTRYLAVGKLVESLGLLGLSDAALRAVLEAGRSACVGMPGPEPSVVEETEEGRRPVPPASGLQ